MKSLLISLVVLSAISSLLAQAPAQKPAPPKGTALTEAAQLIDEVYKNDLALANTPERKTALAQKLLAAGKAEKDTAARYALLTRAKDISVELGDIDTAVEAIAELDRAFDIDAMKLTIDAGSATAKAARTTDQRQELAARMGDLVDQALSADRYDIAVMASEIALTAARRTDNAALAKEAAARAQQVRDAAAAYADVKKALSTLADKPTDPDANLRVGKFRCFMKGDWDSGLPMLALGADAALRELARKEAVGAATAQEQVKIADQWWEQGEKESALARKPIRQHAAKWYAKAVPQLDGLAKAKAEKRIQEAASADATAATRPIRRELLYSMQGSTNRKVAGAIVLQEGELIKTAQPFKPPVQFTIVAQTSSTNIRLGYAADQIIFNWEQNPDELRIGGGPAGGRHLAGAGRIPANTWVQIDLVVQTDSLTISVDGQQRYQTQADFSGVNDCLRIFQGAGSVVKVKSVQVCRPQ